jgi:hypothetical protein
LEKIECFIPKLIAGIAKMGEMKLHISFCVHSLKTVTSWRSQIDDFSKDAEKFFFKQNCFEGTACPLKTLALQASELIPSSSTPLLVFILCSDFSKNELDNVLSDELSLPLIVNTQPQSFILYIFEKVMQSSNLQIFYRKKLF